MAVAKKARVRRQMTANLSQRLVAAGGGDTIGFEIESLLQFKPPALPFGDLQTSAELRFNLIERVSEQAGQKGGAACAFDELTRARQQTEHDAHQGWAGHI